MYAAPNPQKEFIEEVEKAGLQIKVATTFEEAHHLLSTKKFDAVVLDPELPYESQIKTAEH